MFLSWLGIYSNGTLVRDVAFKPGLNLILDSETRLGTESGNSVGKTTLLRVVDYCLGSDGKDIYTDPEFKSETNQEVCEFVSHHHVVAILKITLDGGRELNLKRNIVVDGAKYFKINGEDVSSITKYREELSKWIFKNSAPKPTLRQLIPKFVRSDAGKMSNTVMYLHDSVAHSVYEPIYLFLFGFPEPNLFAEKNLLSRDRKEYEKRLSAYEKPHSKNAIEQMLGVVRGNIEAEEEKISEFRVSDAYHRELGKIKDIRSEISRLSSEVSELDLRIELNEETIKELNDASNEIDVETVKRLYDDVTVSLPEVGKEFGEVLDFHFKMLSNKVKFIEKSLVRLSSERSSIKNRLDKVLREESELLRSLTNTGTLGDLEILRLELSRLSEQKGALESSLEKIDETSEALENISVRLDKVNQKIERYIADFGVKVADFNKYFSRYSKSLYGEEYIFSYDKAKDGKYYKFKISDISGNVGGGKKKGQVAAFDLAFVSFVSELGLSFPRFVMHDSIEDVHVNQVKTLFDLANDLDGQYVVSVLKDKVRFLGEEYIRANQVLELDQHNKFFRV